MKRALESAPAAAPAPGEPPQKREKLDACTPALASAPAHCLAPAPSLAVPLRPLVDLAKALNLNEWLQAQVQEQARLLAKGRGELAGTEERRTVLSTQYKAHLEELARLHKLMDAQLTDEIDASFLRLEKLVPGESWQSPDSKLFHDLLDGGVELARQTQAVLDTTALARNQAASVAKLDARLAGLYEIRGAIMDDAVTSVSPSSLQMLRLLVSKALAGEKIDIDEAVK